MSLVGNFAFGNNDHTQDTSGIGSGRRPSQQHIDTENQFQGMHRQTVNSPSRSRRSGDVEDVEKAKMDTDDDNTTISKSASQTPAESGYKSNEISEKNGSDSDSLEEARRDAEVLALARKMTSHSHHSAVGKNPFNAEPNSSLDPNGENFSSRAWAKAMLHLQQNDPNTAPGRTAGVAFRHLNVHGYGTEADYQRSVGNIFFQIVGLAKKIAGVGQSRIDILRDFEGLVDSGEMLVVLGPPGSGCSTLLKTIAGETHGFNVDENSYLNYQGVSAQDMAKHFRGEAIYTAEVDVHFPMLSVGDTLYFAARARAPRHLPGGVGLTEYATHMRDVIMAMFGITHTINTRVGNDFVRGVSGGERKRVSIAEAALSQAPLQCWDNSTRGLDSANAVEFCKTLQTSTELMGATAAVAIYQAPQNAYDLFHKVIVLYEGHQIFFGPANRARQYFEGLGFQSPERATTADFCTSMTSPLERVVRPGFENRVPRSPEEFAQAWKNSPERAELMRQIDEFDAKYTIGGEYLEKFKQSRAAQQGKGQRIKSPYTLSYVQQINLCLWRGFQRLKGDPSLTFTQLFGNFILALVIGSVFYNLPNDTSSFFARGALLFFAILMNAFGSALEILTLYAQRPIVEKHSRYALYHPSAEAFASMLTDMPYKIMNAIIFNLTIYFMTNLRREPGPFFFFLLISFFLTLAMSMLFRVIASVSRTLTQALAPAAILILAIVIYTGFVIPVDYMLGWARWINYLNVVGYGFESLMINEFHNRNFTCAAFIPSAQFGQEYAEAGLFNKVCSTVGSVPGSDYVNGDAFILSSYQYVHSHKWRNFGIMLAFVAGLMCFYLLAAEYISSKKSKGEVLVFRRGHAPAILTNKKKADAENGHDGGIVALSSTKVDHRAMIQKQTAIFHWSDVCYDIKIKGKPRRILDHVDGWVKPGTLTALMGVSGAGKTTLLDVLATRYTMGVVSGEMLVDGRMRDASFQRKTGYVQQQDLHLSTSTIREALNFSALLRQPAHIARADKLAYVDEVIRLLDMEEYADAVVGVPGEGLNVEQRKRLTIGVELAAKPELLIFLDEPTSGLDSQTSWTICDLMEKLARDSHQAVLFTIHQPSAILFQRFDRLLFLKSGGQTVYFGDIGDNSEKMIKYFEGKGGFPCPKDANPAEWMLEVIGAAPGSTTDIDWHQTWRDSPEYAEVHEELNRLKTELPELTTVTTSSSDKASYREFAAPFGQQFWLVTKRVFEQYWRTPSYIYSKTALCLFSGLFIGFSFFNVRNTQQGLQNQLFAMFMLMTIFGQLVQQIMPHFVTQRSLYEVRERPSKTYSWKAFILSNLLVELPWNTLMSVILYFTFYYPVGFYRNAQPTDAVTTRGAQMFLFIWVFLLFTSTFAHMIIAGIEDAETGGNIANLMFSLCLIFSGVLQSADALPRFWIFMYRVSPFTYMISGMLSTAVANTDVTCADNELLHFDPPDGRTCGDYLKAYTEATGGRVYNSEALSDCNLCQVSSTNTFLSAVNINYSDAWRNFGIIWVYIGVNIIGAIALYWLVRMPKKQKDKKDKKE